MPNCVVAIAGLGRVSIPRGPGNGVNLRATGIEILVENLNAAPVLAKIDSCVTHARLAPGTVRWAIVPVKVERGDRRAGSNVRSPLHKFALLPLARGWQGRIKIGSEGPSA
jgi:hypothetical protein